MYCTGTMPGRTCTPVLLPLKLLSCWADGGDKSVEEFVDVRDTSGVPLGCLV